MSLAPRFTTPPMPPVNYKYSLALHILNNVASKIVDRSVPLTRRISMAYTWLELLRVLAPDVHAKHVDAEKDVGEWGDAELEAAARALTEYAASLLKEVVSTARMY